MGVGSPGQPLLPYDISSQGLYLPGAKVIASKMSSDQKCTPSIPQAEKKNPKNREVHNCLRALVNGIWDHDFANSYLH